MNTSENDTLSTLSDDILLKPNTNLSVNQDELYYVDTRDDVQKLVDLWNDLEVKPYIRVKDHSDLFNKRKSDPFDDGSGSKSGIEIGIKISF